MKRSELKRLIREVVEEVEQTNNKVKQAEMEYVKAKLEEKPEIANQIMDRFKAVMAKTGEGEDKIAEADIGRLFDPKWMAISATAMLAAAPFYVVSKILDSKSTLGPDIVERIEMWFEDYYDNHIRIKMLNPDKKWRDAARDRLNARIKKQMGLD